MRKAVIFDIDGTLANNLHRLHFLDGEKKNWINFFSCIGQDLVIPETVGLFRLLYSTNKYTMILASGRPERYRVQTEEWLKRNCIQYHRLFLRKNGDRRPDYVIKHEMIQEIKKEFSIEFAFDDHLSVVKVLRDDGIFCFQCPELTNKKAF